jgi:hypothetical protein
VTVWADFQKCPVCFAELGKPCLTLSGGVAFESSPVEVEADEPHTTRKLRAESARTGGGRG